MSIERFINHKLMKYPRLKKSIKRIYQKCLYAISPKIKSEGNIIRVSPDDSFEYFFGYYDKSPWDVSDRYMLCLRANNTWSDVSPKEAAEIIIIDTEKNNKVSVLGETHSWNVQQGCMLQWLGPEYKNRIIYNDFRAGKYCSIILKLTLESDTVTAVEEKILSAPVYSVSADGAFALTLDFSRLYRLRPGYGYYNMPEATANEKLPDKPCIWKVDFNTGKVTPVLKYTDFANFEHRPEMDCAEHKVNHIMLSPDGKRFMVLHRWFAGNKKYTRLVTCNSDGTEIYNLSDDNMVSHCCWKNSNQIFAFMNKKDNGIGYYLLTDRKKEYERYFPEIDYDGHPSYSPEGNMILFDRYPDRSRVSSVMIGSAANVKNSDVKIIAKVFAPFKYDNETRCDLHPRWNRTGNKICFDSVFEGRRGLYVIDCEASKEKIKFEDLHKIWVIAPKRNFLFKGLKKAGYTVFDPYIGCNKVIPRFIRTLHFKLNFPFKFVWYRKLPNDSPVIAVILREGLVTCDYLKWFRSFFPEVKLIGNFMNKIKDDREIKLLRNFNCEPTTGDPYDADKYNITTEFSALYLRHFIVNKQEPDNDVFYVGRAKKGREDTLNRIVGLLRGQGLNVKTHVVSPYPYGITLGKYKKLMTYEEILSELGKTRAILHLSQGACSGITFRVIESVVNHIKLITDDLSIIDTPVYCRENVFIIGKDKIEEIAEFLNSPFKPITNDITEKFYFDTDVGNYLKEI